ncbi:MAG: Mur ligase domain-containing protein [bacterium]|nr:Mur ligase domain-containing protein [bacterium]
MKIYFSGIGGVGLGPLAEIAQQAGFEIFGSDQNSSPMTQKLISKGAQIHIGEQNGDFLKKKFIEDGVEWLVYTSALPQNHPELVLAQELGLKTSKRDELLNFIIEEKNLKMLAIAGTHGKTTTTGMLIWTLQQLGVPASWSVGTTLTYGESGFFDPRSEFFIYEADEFDRNFLHFSPFLSLITSIDHDHTDVYKTPEEYFSAFQDFAKQSNFTLSWQDQNPQIYSKIHNKILLKSVEESLTLPGDFLLKNATLVLEALDFLAESGFNLGEGYFERAVEALNNFPGTDRRFERIAEGIYSDYGHHPVEIEATLQMAKEVARRQGFSGVSLIYQPHQNVRQHEVAPDYTEQVFKNADEVIWLPTYLSRENPDLEILTPEFLSKNISSKTQIIEMSPELAEKIAQLQAENRLVLAMSAGSLDGWLRQNFKK